MSREPLRSEGKFSPVFNPPTFHSNTLMTAYTAIVKTGDGETVDPVMIPTW